MKEEEEEKLVLINERSKAKAKATRKPCKSEAMPYVAIRKYHINNAKTKAKRKRRFHISKTKKKAKITRNLP
jgi:hypothetical protein